MNVEKMTLEKFDEILPTLTFKLLTYPERHAYEGAGPRCLIANWWVSDTDSLDILFENGDYSVFGFDENEEPWCVEFDGEFGTREELL